MSHSVSCYWRSQSRSLSCSSPCLSIQGFSNVSRSVHAMAQASYPVTKRLIEDASENLVLQGPVGGLPIHCPVRLIHGLDDEEVPYTVSLDLARRLASRNVNLYLVKTANHHLDNTVILNTVIDSIEEVIANAPIDPPRSDMV